ncbi:18437_t:CDS:2 [Dentiscutata erythropus]|uniref:18437_t:CDS:1 n=1 Tax=Dentiscutata erythropus TaxID=1348616 RepID=A0A9N9G5D4_9GLOM|nr:18437_t:CDS:2 [Dentiscutata erythropus]
MQNNLQPVALFNKGIVGNWQKVGDEMKNVGWRVRYIEATQATPGDITLPKSNITFICFNNEQWNSCNSENDNKDIIRNLVNRIKKANQRHKKAFLLIYIENENTQILYDIQTRLLICNITNTILPIHNPTEAISLMRIISDGLCNDNKSLHFQGLEKEQEDINDPTKLTSTNKWVHLVSQMSAGPKKLRLHDCYVLQEGLQTFFNISAATKSQLLDCSLDKETARDVIKFFEQDYIA